MNVSTSAHFGWWVAVGGALGAVLYYLAITVVGPAVGVRRLTVALAMCVCAVLGIVVASGRQGDGYAWVGVGLLGSAVPFTAVVASVVDLAPQEPWRRKALLGAWTVLAGVSMAILGYILADVSSIAFEKVPGRLR
ncbi:MULTISPECIES: hypothetical protein [Rhodococcus]|nr:MULTISPECIES: hypothetical protein [Rhodococcus]MDV7243732.1 hypothetical protein [Rhodococcus oxybenzonivorans]MDV7275026.1 hypothetical protein [Rhodococcus oxybenzonivorans]MDV7335264.1 hypothetical protein [Rhodococcus oxybenzonivorans]MDV7345975.1 hypothetical protein [Rhodococcus oxybenzonivorans]MDV8028521.1 hypothetical protein [Rhodococcus sp. IEGM 27]